MRIFKRKSMPESRCGRAASAIWIGLPMKRLHKRPRCRMHALQERDKSLHKSETDKAHPNSCANFRTLMNGTNDDECPDWYRRNKKGGSTKKAHADSQRGTRQASSSSQSSIKSFAFPKGTESMKREFQEHMALHYFATDTSF